MNELQNFGIVKHEGKTVASYNIVASQNPLDIEGDKTISSHLVIVGDHFNFNGFSIASHGLDNNLPIEVKSYVSNNSILPEILKKQVRMMYGQGLGLFQVDDEENPTQRKWVGIKYPEVAAWLDSWDKDSELEPIQVYLKMVIQEYYTMEGLWNRWLYNASRRINGRVGIPIRGLKHVNGARCRLAKNGQLGIHQLITDEDCDTVMVTDWQLRNTLEVDYYPRFDRANPFKYETAVNYVRDKGFDEPIYATPTYYLGLKPWLKISNSAPKNVDSYYKNSLSAKLHVEIPNAWIEQMEAQLKKICEDNYVRQTDGKKLITEFEGVEIGVTFSYDLLTQLINKKILAVTNVLSGSGENQGKTFWSRTFYSQHGPEGWKFTEIPTKYKEYIETILSANKEALKMILGGKGVDPAISNMGNDGVFNSGAQVYYSYLVYLDTLGFAEEIILEDLNRALWINFPRLQKDRVKAGFKRFAPPKQQDTAPTDRITAQPANSITKPTNS